jgi:hypothetical protein
MELLGCFIYIYSLSLPFKKVVFTPFDEPHNHFLVTKAIRILMKLNFTTSESFDINDTWNLVVAFCY